MLQLLLLGCIFFPLLAAAAAGLDKDGRSRRVIVFTGVGVTALSALGLALYGSFTLPVTTGGGLSELMTVLDFALLLVILYIASRMRHKLCAMLAVAQLLGMAYLDFALLDGPAPAMFKADALSLVMVLVISFVGGIVCMYALGYMKEHEDHLRLTVSRQPRFFFIVLLFLGAMNGLVLCDSLPWIFFFWEVTTLCSFLLISHDGTREARANALRALWMNMLGGLAFVAAMLFTQKALGTLSVERIIEVMGDPAAHTAATLLPLAFLAFAGFTKAAQLPFQSWLCGAMVAPTPVSALLHSSTMVKAGVYLVLRISPALAGTMLAGVIALMGAFTFVATSALACGQSNGKKVLAYSTIANLGLIIACAGIGTPAAVAAGVLLIIFHAVSKGLLFLCVGAVEQQIGSRDIEDMRGLYRVMPRTAIIMMIGMMTMMLPPFGALLAKWMAMEAAAAAPAFMPVLVTLIAFGSALTVLFWARWAGLVLGGDPLAAEKPAAEQMPASMTCALRALLWGAILLSLLVPFIFAGIDDAIRILYGTNGAFSVSGGVFRNSMGAFAVYPLFALLALGVWLSLRQARRAAVRKPDLPYFSGIQQTEEGKLGFNGPLNVFVENRSSNYYLEAWFGEEKLTGKLNTIALVLLVVMLGGLL